MELTSFSENPNRNIFKCHKHLPDGDFYTKVDFRHCFQIY
jgi:hypothetical protein